MQCESRVGTCALDMLKGRQNSGLEPYSKAKEKKIDTCLLGGY